MINTATRKRASLAAIASLVVSGFAGLPAQATNTYFTMEAAYGPAANLTAVQGLGYGITLKTDFVTIPSGLSAADLAYELTITSDGHEIETDTSASLTHINVDAYTTVSSTVPSATVMQYSTHSSVVSQSVAATPTKAVIQATGSGQSIAASNYLHLETATVSDPITIEVRAFLDNNGNSIKDTAEIAVSDVYTVTFVPAEDVAFSLAFQSTLIGASTTSVTVTPGSLNPRNFLVYGGGDSMDVNFGSVKPNATTGAQAGMVSSSSPAVTWDATNSWLEATISGTDMAQAFSISGQTTVSAAALYAVLRLDGALPVVTTGEFSTNESLPATATLDLEAKSASLLTLSAVATAAVSQDATRQGAEDTVAVLEGTKTIGFKVAITDADGEVVRNGMTVTVTLGDGAGTTGLGTSTITSNGKTLLRTGVNSVTFDLTTNIAGEIEFEVAADKAVAGENFTVAASAEGVASNTLTVTWAKEALTVYGPANTTIAPKDTFVANYIVVNQFGSVVTGDYQLVVTRARASGTRTDALGTTANWAYTAPVTNGAARVTIVDNGGAATGVDTVTATLQKKAAQGGAYANVASNVTNDTFNLTYSTSLTGAALTAKVNNNGVKAGTVTVKAIALEAEALVAYDSRTSADAPDYAAFNAFASATATTASSLVTITGTLKSSTGANLTGVPVTLTGKSVVFGVGDDYYLDSASVLTSAGAYSVTVRGGLSGKQTITITALGQTQTIDLTFAAGSVAASNMVITAPATSNPGKVVDVIVKVTDAKGNAASDVAVTLKSTGPGYLNVMSGTTDATGELIVKLITLTNDNGTATVTATATLLGVVTSKAASITIGSAPAEVNAVIGSFQGRWAVRVENAKGSTVTVRVGGNWVKYTALNDNYLFSRASRVGATVAVSVWVDGELQNSQTITVK